MEAFGGALVVWQVLESSTAYALAEAFAFIIVFVATSWQEIRKK